MCECDWYLWTSKLGYLFTKKERVSQVASEEELYAFPKDQETQSLFWKIHVIQQTKKDPRCDQPLQSVLSCQHLDLSYCFSVTFTLTLPFAKRSFVSLHFVLAGSTVQACGSNCTRAVVLVGPDHLFPCKCNSYM